MERLADPSREAGRAPERKGSMDAVSVGGPVAAAAMETAQLSAMCWDVIRLPGQGSTKEL